MSQIERQRQWEARVAEFRTSGLGPARWCREHGVKVKQLYYWLKKSRGAGTEPEATAQWVQVTVAEPEASAPALDIRVGHAVIEVRHGFDPELLANVVRALLAC
ncbi:MAG: helix-turn-helix domain-containing protein [Dehalococcoidia bacterium]|nr:helix-turn-helix domain-containing protein [Dehalococcoidia bacterium]